jgi:hypothetical protein
VRGAPTFGPQKIAADDEDWVLARDLIFVPKGGNF